jgi:uncharacterized protein (TIGR00288 family)
MAAPTDFTSMALFCDFENIALGVRDASYDKFDITKVLERLLLKGSIVVKKAYCDWERYREYKATMHQASFELIEIPHARMSGKNSADIRLVVDALDLCYTKSHVDCFVIISGDSDFSPLVSKLRENAKTVIGIGVKKSTSDLLIKNCDEFIFYDDLVREPKRRSAARARGDAQPATSRAPRNDATAGTTSTPPPLASDAAAKGTTAAKATKARKSTSAGSGTGTGKSPGSGAGTADQADRPRGNVSLDVPAGAPAVLARHEGLAKGAALEAEDEAGIPDERVQRGLDLILETVDALVAERGEDERIWGSMVKQTLKRRNPGFSELYYGYKTFNRMLEDARDRRLLTLEQDDKSGGYLVRAA